MIKKLLGDLIGVDPDVWDSQENQDDWARQKEEDESDGDEVEADE